MEEPIGGARLEMEGGSHYPTRTLWGRTRRFLVERIAGVSVRRPIMPSRVAGLDAAPAGDHHRMERGRDRVPTVRASNRAA